MPAPHDFHQKQNIYFCMNAAQMGDTVWWLHGLSRLRETLPKDEYNILCPNIHIDRPGADGKTHQSAAYNRLLFGARDLGVYWVHSDGRIETPNQKIYHNDKDEPNFTDTDFSEIEKFKFAVFETTHGVSKLPFYEDACERSNNRIFTYKLPEIMFFKQHPEFDIESDAVRAQNETFNKHVQNSIHVVDDFCGKLDKFLRREMNVVLAPHTHPYLKPIDKNTELPPEVLYNIGGAKRPLVVIQTGTGVANSKNIEPDIWRSVGIKLHQAGCTVVFIGRGNDPDPMLGQNVMGIISHVREHNLPGTSRFLKNCDLVISGDTGVAHLAAAYGTPTLTIFGTGSSLQQAHPYPNAGKEENVYALQKPNQYDMFNPQPPQSSADEIFAAATTILEKLDKITFQPDKKLNLHPNLLQPAIKRNLPATTARVMAEPPLV